MNKPKWYANLHGRMGRRVPKPDICVEDGCTSPPYDLANISQEYKEDVKDWEYLCRKCHMTKDGRRDELIKNNKNRLLSRLRKLQRNNKSGRVGVRWAYEHARWEARIKVKEKNIYLGSFKNKDDAIQARKEGEKKYYGI